jgi:hypothetical protein
MSRFYILLILYFPHSHSFQIGFLSTSRSSIPEPGPGVRYRVQSSGEWTPMSTSDLGSMWGGTQVWVRAQGEAIAKSIWYHSRWSGDSILSINWTGMSNAEREENRLWCEEYARLREEVKMQWRSERANRMEPKVLTRSLECRGGCGEKNSKLVCSRCKETCACLMFYDDGKRSF